MNDLKLLGAALAQPDPAPEVADRSRQGLRNAMRGRKRRRRIGRPVAGLSLTAIAVVAAIVVASGTTEPPATQDNPSTAAQPSARQVLLAAAATAETVPEGSGSYWHVTMKHGPSIGGRRLTEMWFRRDGQGWVSVKPGEVSKLARWQVTTFLLTGMSSRQLQNLPTDPAALKTWILNAMKLRRSKENPHSRYEPSTLEVNLVHVLNEMLYFLPVQQKVRAAAFRALASLPSIKRVGAVKEGQVLVYMSGPGRGQVGIRMIVDPKTTRVGIENFTDFGKRESSGTNTYTGEWTDQIPDKVVPPPRRYHPRAGEG
ncbi:CU044_5270 family protein [Actinomadura sp. HBU206391]|uniref:CU044_5270 family protein n=1 Tax=Actinomadura sp. HBU206391 TaxID=2731692 RepID=UPI00165099FA|nr:CU044_5270 family protein [Actinomadura sp. HBU206391]MBC6459832.1 CU044_5270 family protein [Actinomadura sp. HBU206391]